MAWLGASAAALGIAAHFVGLVSSTASRVAAFAPVFVVIGVISAVFFVVLRRWTSAVVVALVVVVGFTTQAPLYVGESPPRSELDLSVLQVNIYEGRADIAAVVKLVDDLDVDVLTVVELTPSALVDLEEQLVNRLPHSFSSDREGGGGIGLFSRYPLTEPRLIPGLAMGNIRAEIRPDGSAPIAVYALHPVPPFPLPAWHWDRELGRLTEVLAQERLPFVVGGDFNSTYDHRKFRDLIADSSGDTLLASEYLGSGFVPTYPANSLIPPLLAIDHVLVGNGPIPASFQTVELPRSDHRGVAATIRLPGADNS